MRLSHVIIVKGRISYYLYYPTGSTFHRRQGDHEISRNHEGFPVRGRGVGGGGGGSWLVRPCVEGYAF